MAPVALCPGESEWRDRHPTYQWQYRVWARAGNLDIVEISSATENHADLMADYIIAQTPRTLDGSSLPAGLAATNEALTAQMNLMHLVRPDLFVQLRLHAMLWASQLCQAHAALNRRDQAGRDAATPSTGRTGPQ